MSLYSPQDPQISSELRSDKEFQQLNFCYCIYQSCGHFQPNRMYINEEHIYL